MRETDASDCRRSPRVFLVDVDDVDTDNCVLGVINGDVCLLDALVVDGDDRNLV